MLINKQTLITLLAIFSFITVFSQKDESDSFKIEYEKFTLENGLEVVLHEDHSDPIVAVATMLHVGSNREKPGKTGFAHFFEHMSFNDSENVPRGANRKVIPEWGGSRNGGTWSDGTVYYEVVPKDAFEKILWIDSDRLGYMINTVTKDALEREKQVVKNEKRQRVDNSAYGFTDEIIRSNLYPKDHPYHWTVIGSLPDLQAATLEDVKEFYNNYYGASNASLVIAGDINIKETKKLVEKWFGEIRRGPDIEPLKPMPVSLEKSKSLYFEDNFAKLPELRIVIPTVEKYHEDMYALESLSYLLSGSKKSPLYKTIVEEKKLAPSVSCYQSSSEIAGEFVFRIRANENVDLDEVKFAIEESLIDFEKNGFTDNELKRIKAELETSLFESIETILYKAFQLVQDNEYIGDPGYAVKTAEYTNAVTREDVMRVFKKYIKDKPYVMTSVIPKGQLELRVENSELAEVYQEEIVENAEGEEVSQGEEAVYEKTKTKHDRSEPEFGELPKFQMPEIWTAQLNNEMKVYGIENQEIPLINFSLTLSGGHLLDPFDKAGVAYLLADLLMEGTANKTPAELEEAIGLLGADINIYSSFEEIEISATCLVKNYKKTLELVEEILLEPRWDETEFDRLKQALLTRIKGREANPRSIGAIAFNKLLYGENHIFSIPGSGTLETAEKISIEDLKSYYKTNFSANVAKFHIAGAINEKDVLESLKKLEAYWSKKEVSFPKYQIPKEKPENKVYFIDIPGSKQSVIFAGKMVLSAADEDFNNLNCANEILGGGSSGQLFQTLRIEKGYTYGAYSYIYNTKEIAPYAINTSVRSNATLASLEIIDSLLSNYLTNYSETEVEITQNKLLKESTRAYEDLYSKLRILKEISKYDKSLKFIEENQAELVSMSLDDFKKTIEKYIVENEMIYLIVGDGESQLTQIDMFGKGNVIELDIFGNPVN